MAAATERVPVLMTPAEKKRVVSEAKKAGLTTSRGILMLLQIERDRSITKYMI